MCVSKVQEVTSIDNGDGKGEDTVQLGIKLYNAATASFHQKHLIRPSLRITEITEGRISDTRGGDHHILLHNLYFTSNNNAVSGRCVITLEGDSAVNIAWRKDAPHGKIEKFCVKAINPDAECLRRLKADKLMHRLNITAIGERYEAGAPDHPYKKET